MKGFVKLLVASLALYLFALAFPIHVAKADVKILGGKIVVVDGAFICDCAADKDEGCKCRVNKIIEPGGE